MKRAILSLAGIGIGVTAWIVTSACSTATIQTPERSFDRPTDVALTCARLDTATGLYNIRATADCNPNDTPQTDMGVLANVPFLGPDPNTQFLLALVTQSARGEVALVDTARNKLVSLQPKLPGFGFLPVGLLPEHIRTTPDGCTAVTSNTDSCDYAVINVSTMINGGVPVPDGGMPIDQTNVVRRIVAAVPDGKGGARVLPARPSWVEIAPDSTSAVHGEDPGGKSGMCLGGTNKAWVALPNCELLVELNLDAPKIAEVDPTHPKIPTVLQAIKVTKAGAQVVTDLTTLSCPVECAGIGVDGGAGSDLALPATSTPSDGGIRDGGAGDLGAPPLVNTTQAYPGTIAIDSAGGRMIVGDLYGERIDIIPVDNTGKLGTPRKVQLEHGAAGVTVVRVSPRSYAGQFLYAIARDGTVHVVDLDRETECETNPDPRFSGGGVNLQNTDPPADPTPQARQLGCFPLGDPGTPPRAWYATGPGIQLNLGQLPKDIAFIHVELPPGAIDTTLPPPSAAPGLLVGDFAWIITSDGRGTLVDIFDACPQPNQQDLNVALTGPFTKICALGNVPISRAQTVQLYGHPTPLTLDRLAHRLRGGTQRFLTPTTPSDVIGMPRVVDEFNPYAVAIPSTAATADAGIANTDAGVSPNLPGLYQETLPLTLTQTTDTAPTRVIKFVDPDRARNEVWSVVWEGQLPGTAKALGQWLPSGYFTDSGGAFCSHGVVAGDKLVYSGCQQDGDCDYKFVCVHDPNAPADVLSGMCLPIGGDTYTVDYWSRMCGPLLRAQRKYRIVSVRTQQPLPVGIPPGPPPGTIPMLPDLGGAGTPAPTLPTDFLKLAEIYEPEYTEQTATCGSDADCSAVTIPPANGAAGDLATRCMPDFDGVKRCLLGCDPALGDDSGATLPRCGLDFQCAKSTQGDLRCMRSPLDDQLFGLCFPELTPYAISAGDSFTVAGTTSGFAVDTIPDSNGECQVPPLTSEYTRLRQSRVPIQPQLSCPLASPLDSIDTSTLHTNVCLVPPATGQINSAEIVHFENGVFNIAVTIPVDSNGRIIIPPDGTALSFDLTGGGGLLSSPIGVDVQAEDPTYAVVGPDQQTVYVVDAGKSNIASGLRGQLLRLFSPTQTVDSLFVIR